MILYFFLFAASVLALYFVSNWVIEGLSYVARLLKLREFIVAFILMALAASLPNLTVGVFSILRGTPSLSFGDVVGGNVVDLTLAIGLAILVSRKPVTTASRTVQFSALYTFIVGALPALLVIDHNLSRLDGVILLAAFCFFICWLVLKRGSFSQTYALEDRSRGTLAGNNQKFWISIGKMLLGIVVLWLAGEGLVRSAAVFSTGLGLPIGVIGILVVGLGNSLPETYFALASARKGETWMILGDLMGAVIFPATLVLGMVAVFSPIENIDFSPFLISRIFLVLAAFFFMLFVRTGKELSKKEGIALILLYVLFLIIEISRLA